MKKLILLITAALLLSGCYKEPVGEPASDNSAVNVQKMFTVDGCTMYRFHDGWRLIYWTNCPGTTQYYTGGKNNQRVSVTTGSSELENP